MLARLLAACLGGLLVTMAPAYPAAPPLPRGDIHGDPLPRGAIARLGTIRLRQPEQATALALSPDGKLAATTDSTRMIYLWDLPSGKRRAVIASSGLQAAPKVSLRLPSLVFSSDGQLLASYFHGEPIRLIDTRRGQPLSQAVEAHNLTGMAFAPDGKTLAWSQHAEGIRLWDLSRRQVRSFLEPFCAGGIAFSPDGRTLVTGRSDRSAILWDVATGQERRRLLDGGSLCIGFHLAPDGRAVLGSRADGRVQVWDVATGKPRVIPTGSQRPLAARLEADGRLLLVVLGRRLIHQDVKANQEVLLWEDTESEIRTIAFSADGQRAVFLSAGKAFLRILDVRRQQEVLAGPGHGFGLSAVAFSPDGTRVATAGDRGVRLWDAATGRLERTLLGHTDQVTALAFSPDGKSLASAGAARDRTLRLWDLPSGKLRRTFTGHTQALCSVAFSPDGTKVASGEGEGKRGQARIWHLASGNGLPLLPDATAPVRYLAFSWRGQRLLTGGNPVQVWNVASGTLIRRLDGADPRALSPDGRLLVCQTEVGQLSMLEVLTASSVFQITAHCQEILAVAFSPDGRFLASTARGDPGIHLWSAEDGTPAGTLQGHEADVHTLAFAPDGRRLVSGAQDGTALVWSLDALRARRLPVQTASRDARKLAGAWHALGQDASAAHQAMAQLRSDGDRVVRFLADRLRPASQEEGKRLARLVVELDADDFATRERATTELMRAGHRAEHHLVAALAKPSLEQRRRAERVLRFLESLPDSPEDLRALRAVAVLEQINTTPARQLLRRLATGDPHARWTRAASETLSRLERVGGSPRTR